ncbi:MAG: type II secretion system protein [Patescibacteria group bacterium]
MIQKQKNVIIDGCEIKKGFTLIEILVVIGIIAVLAAVILVAINPARQFKLARDSQRISNITAILNAIGQNLAENKGMFICNGSKLDIPTVSTIIKSGEGGFDLAPCVVPTYISSLPFDPSASGAKFVNNTEYDTEYSMYQDTLGRIIISANGEITQNLSVTR